jgi:multidrug/hemolysin transport system ATP-binding protein
LNKIIEVSGLRKSYGSVQAVKGVYFYVEKGKLFALLGPNGAGKSTIIDIICTFLQPDSGRITVDGHELGKEDNAIRGIIGAVFQDGLLDPLLTVEENLTVRGGLYGLKGKKLKDAVSGAAEAAGVTGILRRPYGKLSGGQRRRCDITRALVHTPRILFLDEPTTGLDPQTRKSVWETVTRLQKDHDMTLFLTTHYMEEAAGADYVIVIDEGTIAARGTPADLEEKYTRDKLLLHCRDTAGAAAALAARQTAYTQAGDRLTVSVPTSLDALPLIELCREYLTGFEVVNGSMDDAFIAITGKEIRE